MYSFESKLTFRRITSPLLTAKQESIVKVGGKQRSAFTLVSCLDYSPNVKLKASCSSETSVDFQRTTRHYSPEIKIFTTTAMRTSNHTNIVLKPSHGRAIAQAVSRWRPTAAARVQTRVWSSGFCGGQSGARAGFLRVLRFPLPIFIPPNSPSS
jgi:ABC-type uncharacterized transport system auxiliary subunit